MAQSVKSIRLLTSSLDLRVVSARPVLGSMLGVEPILKNFFKKQEPFNNLAEVHMSSFHFADETEVTQPIYIPSVTKYVYVQQDSEP